MGRERKLPAGMHKRGGVYYARFRSCGRIIRRKLSVDLDAAKDILKELRQRYDKGRFGILDDEVPWEEVRRDFLEWAKQSVRNPRNYERDLEHFEKYLHPRTMAEITSAAVVGFRAWRFSQGAMRKPKVKRGRNDAMETKRFPITARTVNREVGTLQNLLNRAVEWGKLGHNPIAGLKPLKHDHKAKERRSLTLEEVERFLAECPGYLQPVFRAFLTTGCRLNELVEMRFNDIDWDRQTVTILPSTAKNHKARELPLDDELFAAIKELRAKAPERRPMPGPTPEHTKRLAARFSRDHVFVTKANTPWEFNLLKRFRAICRRAGIEDAIPGGAVDIHALRVSFATLAIDNGANPRAVQALLGHSTLNLTMNTYTKTTERSRREAVVALPYVKSISPVHLLAVNPPFGERNACANRKQDTQHIANKDVV